MRKGERNVSVAATIAVAVNTDGKREIVGLHIGPSEAEPFWMSFLRDLVHWGLTGVKLVISDAHEGLKAAITRTLSATWQRCRVHAMRNALAYVPKGQHTMVAAATRRTFIQPDHESAVQTCRHVAERRPSVPCRNKRWKLENLDQDQRPGRRLLGGRWHLGIPCGNLICQPLHMGSRVKSLGKRPNCAANEHHAQSEHSKYHPKLHGRPPALNERSQYRVL